MASIINIFGNDRWMDGWWKAGKMCVRKRWRERGRKLMEIGRERKE